MDNLLSESLQGAAPHVVYFAISLTVAALFILIYTRVTPYKEFKLINEGNPAAAITLGGALIGFTLPLAKAVAQSSSIMDMLIWSAIALIAQLVAYMIVRILNKNLTTEIQQAKTAPAIFLASVSISIGFLNSAAMTL